MSLLAKVEEVRGKVVDAVRKVASREARGEARESDAKTLTDAIRSGDTTPGEYQKIVDLEREYSRLTEESMKLDACGKALSAARKALHAHQAETDSIRRQRVAEAQPLVEEVERCARAIDLAQKAERLRKCFELEHASELGLEAPDPDLFRLEDQNGTTVCGWCLDDAPVLYISAEALKAQQLRRFEILSKLQAEEHARVAAEFKEWEARRPRVMGGMPYEDPSDPAPRERTLTWYDALVSMGKAPVVVEK